MSDIIHLLPDSVANQIAAGEVVQRPASVIKELLENSIDAHATDIQIVLKEAGRDLIQVIDNGVGMSPTDARMAFERHATSKIQQAADLFELHTMGFRGEALASIAAVAEVELRTRKAEDEVGVSLSIAGSKVLSQESVSCPVGANFQIRNLFYNVPARRKFLKSNQTELSNIITELQHVALANPNVGFTLIHNDTVQFQLMPGSVRQRISSLFAKTVGQQLLPIGVDNELLTVTGFVGRPESARKKGALQYFFVNDRFMKHPYFHKAVMTCYEGIIPEGEQPNYFIYLTVDPSTIDVNIHPTKTEIKFENENARWHILMASVREALGKFNAIPSIDFDTTDAPEIPVQSGGRNDMSHLDTVEAPKPEFSSSYNPFRKDTHSIQHWEALYNEFSTSTDRPDQYSNFGQNSSQSGTQTAEGGSVTLSSHDNATVTSTSHDNDTITLSSHDNDTITLSSRESNKKDNSSLDGDMETLPSHGGDLPSHDGDLPSHGGDTKTIPSKESVPEVMTLPSRSMQNAEAELPLNSEATIQKSVQIPSNAKGETAAVTLTSRMSSSLAEHKNRRYMQVGGRYILTALKTGLILIDMHRAHVNVLYERYCAQVNRRQGVTQTELFPEIIAISPADEPIFDSILEDLSYLGFELDNLGGGSYSMSGKPASLESVNVQDLLLSLIDIARQHEKGIREELDRQLVLKLSETQAIAYGQLMTDDEMEQLVDELFALPAPSYTPNGKTVIVQLSYEELSQRF